MIVELGDETREPDDMTDTTPYCVVRTSIHDTNTELELSHGVDDPNAELVLLVRVGKHHFALYRDAWYQCRFKIGQFSKFSIPLIRRVYPPLIAQKLVSVQPMTQPASLLYYLRHRHATNKGESN